MIDTPTKNGVKTGWFEHGDAKIYFEEEGMGDPVLLLPGFTMSIQGFAALRKALAEKYHVISADLPGSGKSLPQPRKYTASYFDEDARAFAALLEHLQVGPTHVMGFSDGGEDALLMAELTPEATRSIVIWGAAGSLSDPSGQLRHAMFNLIDQPIPPLQGFRDHLVEVYGEENARAMTQSEVTALGEIIDRGGNLSLSRAGTIHCPVLVIVGENDMFVPVTLAQQLATKIPDAKVVIAEGAQHDAHNANPEWFARTVMEWLKGK